MLALKTLKAGEEREELDELTLERAKRGDGAAFGVLVRFYERPVFALLARMLFGAQRHLVEDLAQETFVRAYRAISGFGSDGRQHLSSWLLTIATRIALDELRKRSFATEIPSAELPSTHRTDALVERHALAEAIERAVQALPPEYRAAFLLREAHDSDYDAIAAALNVDLGTVKSRLSRARTTLRLALRKFLLKKPNLQRARPTRAHGFYLRES